MISHTKTLVALVAIAALVLLLLYLQGTIGGRKVRPGTVPLYEAAPQGRSVPVEHREVEDLVDWPGTLRSRNVAEVAPRVMARVLEVRVTLGDEIGAGDILAVLDDRELRAHAAQARAALAAAEADSQGAAADLRRGQMLFAEQAMTPQDLDALQARSKAALAHVAQARDGIAAAEVMLAETILSAPFDGVVAARRIDPGDMATPGQPVVVIHDPRNLRLEARVSERCAGRLTPGTEVSARIDAPPRDLLARIEEIAPAADSESRTFLVKASLPADEALRSGTFGRLRIPCGKHGALLVPATAVGRAGQLETVTVVADGAARLRHVRTGRTLGDRVEVLTGLAAGERVLVQEDAALPAVD